MRPITVSIGPNAAVPIGTPLARMDDWAPPSISIQCVVTGAVNYTVQTSNDDPNDPSTPIAVGSMTWSSSPDAAAVTATGNIMTTLSFVPRFVRILLNSGTGTVVATILQAGVNPA